MYKAEDVLKEAMELKALKSKDYQGQMWREEDYFPFKDLSYLQMVHTKYIRIRSVVEQNEVNFESLEDSLIDLINYSAMWAAYIKNQKVLQDAN